MPFYVTIAPILAAAGPLPPAQLDTGSETTRSKKQAARLLKCECEACGYTMRTARKWLEAVGAPLCPFVDHGPMRHDHSTPAVASLTLAAKRLIIFTTKRLSGISRLAA